MKRAISELGNYPVAHLVLKVGFLFGMIPNR